MTSYILVLAQEHYKNVGNEVRKGNLEAMREQMAMFKDKLEEFAINHRTDIRKDPAFRAQFHAMCANIGVDPLASNKVSLTCAQRGCAAAARGGSPSTKRCGLDSQAGIPSHTDLSFGPAD